MITDRPHSSLDCRIWGAKYEALWTTSHRSEFLLNPEVTIPLSIDQNVWPCVFGDNGPLQQFGLIEKTIPMPEVVLQRGSMWKDVCEIDDELKSRDISHDYAKIIQIFQFEETRSSESIESVNSGFEIVGFDVADEMTISALAGCGLSEPEWRELRPRFRRCLNDHHLFDYLDEAVEYCSEASRLIPEHAPFKPYLLAWRVDGPSLVDL